MTDESEDEEATEIETLGDVHCVAHHEVMDSPNHGEVEHVWFDEDILGEWVYRELLDALRQDGYQVLSFGSVNAEEAEEIPAEGVVEGGKKAVFVYRGEPQ